VVSGDAPKGHENWFVMINAPENTGQDWHAMTAIAREHILKKIKKIVGTDIEANLVFEEVANPETIERNTGSYHGSLYGLSSNNIWSAFRRHPNYLRSIKGLYFVGGSVHPGGGIPLCLASAKIVDDLFPKLKHNDR
jgi:phytoene dehydrogenase-like protein